MAKLGGVKKGTGSGGVRKGGAAAIEAIDRLRKEGVKWVSLQFVDLIGGLQNITVPAHTIDEDSFLAGIGKLDGSSIKGFKAIEESDMVMKPDPSTLVILPWYGEQDKTARFFVDVYEGGGIERFTRDSRAIAQRAEEFAAKSGYDTTYWGPELEFFVFDGVRLLPTPDAVRNPWAGCGYEIISNEAPWAHGDGKNYPIRFKEGYYPAPPQDTLMEFRNEACRLMEDVFGIELDAHHHEVATAGQCEINMKYDKLANIGDKVITYKYVLKMVAAKHNKLVTFMPKPI
ncbi:MAG TPA: glutamine synthetase beta-grasp domain-containing protein, partial [Thermoplasmata archaeon]|nr:glutamine synthetase beta-grasp domain-containing protein [Thermoplasmata archaeon]